ncbi:hypothetical protein LWC33_26625 [Pseudonocardia sp. RS11V-5]|uniref:hypothetical protein n=1 Tax=Pseudonocardia terrae TaxID=2905831 RepID=UPI001E5F6351|nr:hypothetical protein [Pseudonocardia terrae]MCE3555016.1 hypothetical protein [Pseudonocardia terrae]
MSRTFSRRPRTALRAGLILAASGVLVWVGGAAPALAQFSPPTYVTCTNLPGLGTGVAVGQASAPVPAGLCGPVGGFSAPTAPGVPPAPPAPPMVPGSPF